VCSFCVHFFYFFFICILCCCCRYDEIKMYIFQWSKSRFSGFKETCALDHQRAVAPYKSLFYRCWPVFRENGCYLWQQTFKWYQHRSLWKTINFRNKGFLLIFCDLRLQRTPQEWTATKWLEIDWQFANRNCYRLSRVSWALAQISCTCTYHTALLVSLCQRRIGWKSQIFPTLLLFSGLARGDPFQINKKSFTNHKNSLPAGSRRWRFGDPNLHRFWLIHPCDERTDGQTDRRTDRIAMAMTHYGVKRKRRPRFWIHPDIANQDDQGDYLYLIHELSSDPAFHGDTFSCLLSSLTTYSG